VKEVFGLSCVESGLSLLLWRMREKVGGRARRYIVDIWVNVLKVS
jgi:hypothetical protein